MIPKHAKKVFKGIMFDTYHWSQKMFNGKSRTFEKLKRQDSVTVIATVNGKILALDQKQPGHKNWYLDLPGGRMDKPGETPKNCAIRELLEETGFTSTSFKLMKTFTKQGHINYKVYVFIASNCIKIADQKLDGGEIIKTKLITYKQFRELNLDEKFYADPYVKLFFIKSLISKTFDAWLKKQIFG